MLVAAAILLGLTALGGITLFSLRLRGGNPPLLLVRVHGALAAIGLTALLIGLVVARAFVAPLVALVVLSVAAGLGVWMAKQHAAGRLVPIGAVFLHALLVLLGGAAFLAHFLG